MKAPRPSTATATEMQALGGAFSPYPGLVAVIDRDEPQDARRANNWDMLVLVIAISTLSLLYLVRA